MKEELQAELREALKRWASATAEHEGVRHVRMGGGLNLMLYEGLPCGFLSINGCGIVDISEKHDLKPFTAEFARLTITAINALLGGGGA